MGRLLAFMAVCSGIAVMAAGILGKEPQNVVVGAGVVASGVALKFGQKTQEKNNG
jgi:hypothetical protein